jgi:hypothetical protein
MTPLFSIESRHYCLLVDIHFAKYSQVDEVLADLPTADNNLRSFQTHKIDHGLCHQCGLPVTSQNPVDTSLGWVLKCSSITEKEITSITLHFWFRLVVDMEAMEPYDF